MANYRNYKVVLIDGTEIKISADDINLDTCGGDNECNCHWFNFMMGEATVCAIPFSQVRYITS